MLKARGKLNVVLLSWERNVGLHYQSKNCDEKRVVAVVHVGQSSQVSVWKSDLTKDTLITPTPRHFIASRDQSLVERTVPKGSSKSMQSRELFAYSSGLKFYLRGTVNPRNTLQ